MVSGRFYQCLKSVGDGGEQGDLVNNIQIYFSVGGCPNPASLKETPGLDVKVSIF